MKSILTNESIAGVLVYGRKPKPGNPQAEIVRVSEFFPAILTNDEWVALKQRLDIRREHSRGGTHKSEYLLSGIVRCGHCGGPMTGKVGYAYKGAVIVATGVPTPANLVPAALTTTGTRRPS